MPKECPKNARRMPESPDARSPDRSIDCPIDGLANRLDCPIAARVGGDPRVALDGARAQAVRRDDRRARQAAPRERRRGRAARRADGRGVAPHRPAAPRVQRLLDGQAREACPGENVPATTCPLFSRLAAC
eukprot:3478893-Prymnesium_polylepis.1